MKLRKPGDVLLAGAVIGGMAGTIQFVMSGDLGGSVVTFFVWTAAFAVVWYGPRR